MRRLLCIIVLAIAGCSSETAAPGACVNNSECEAGSVCQAGGCVELCRADSDCEMSEACLAGICGPCAGCRQIPEVVTLDGTGNADGPPHVAHHLRSSVVLVGANLEGASVTLTGPGFNAEPLLTCGTPTTDRVEAELPAGIQPGDYVLTVSNQAGSCDATMQLLQGETGPPGSYTIGSGLTLTGSDLSVDASVSGVVSEVTAARDGEADLDTRLDLMATPVGTVVAYAGAMIPAGWLVCDGSEVDRVTYADLYAVLGVSWGGGDLMTTFNLPDLRGRFLRGVDDGSGNDPDAASRVEQALGGNTGDAVGSLQADATAVPGTNFTINATDPGNHNHPMSYPFSNCDGTNSLRFRNGDNSNCRHTESNNSGMGGGHTHAGTVNGGGDAETRPMNAYVYYIIKH